MSDLAEKLLKVVDHLDRLAEAAIQDGYSLSVVGERGENYFSTCSPEDTRRRCAADREIVKLHEPVDALLEYFLGPKVPVCSVCAEPNHGLVSKDDEYPCETLRLLARGYGIQP